MNFSQTNHWSKDSGWEFLGETIQMEAAELLDIAKYLDHSKVYSKTPIPRTILFLKIADNSNQT